MNKLTYFAHVLVLLAIPCSVWAGVNLPWSTTFDCPEWNHISDPLECPGIDKHGGWSAQPGNKYEEISAQANHPAGDGGKGARHWTGDGTNNGSGSIEIYFNSPQDRVWVRWYQRWEPGFKATPIYMTKELYFWNTGPNQIVHEMNLPDGGGWGTVFVGGGQGHYYNEGGFKYWYPSGTSDGSWVLFEVLVDIPNGKYKYWVNEELLLDKNINFPTNPKLESICFQINSKGVDNGIGRPMYIDYDDVAISNTGYIGPLSGGGGQFSLSTPAGFSIN